MNVRVYCYTSESGEDRDVFFAVAGYYPGYVMRAKPRCYAVNMRDVMLNGRVKPDAAVATLF
jgi:hypothetical protein